MMRARFIVVDQFTGEVLNAYIVECAASWPPPFTGTISLADVQCKYNVGDVVGDEALQTIKQWNNDASKD